MGRVNQQITSRFPLCKYSMFYKSLHEYIEVVQDYLLNEALHDIQDYLRPYSDDSQAFVTFSNLPKLGINPQTDYNTPAGIYSYPIQAVWPQIVKNTLPFAGERKYAVVFQPKTSQGIVIVENYTEDQYQQAKDRLIQDVLPQLRYPGDISQVIEQGEAGSKLDLPAGRLWNVTRLAAQQMAQTTRPTVAWNIILRRLGIAGVIDRGEGLIHPNEPIQAYWTSREPLQKLGVFPNIRKKDLTTHEVKRWLEYDGTKIFQIHHRTIDLWLTALRTNVPQVLAYALQEKIKIPEKALLLASKYNGPTFWTTFVILDMLDTKYPFSQKFLASLAEHCRAAFIPLIEKRMLTPDLAAISVKHWPGRLKQLRDHRRDIPTELVDLATQEHDEDAIWAATALPFLTTQSEKNCRQRLGDETFEILRRRFDRAPS